MELVLERIIRSNNKTLTTWRCAHCRLSIFNYRFSISRHASLVTIYIDHCEMFGSKISLNSYKGKILFALIFLLLISNFVLDFHPLFSYLSEV